MESILAPERMPERDAQGWACHPDLDNLVVDGEEGDELPLDLKKLHAAGYAGCYLLMERDVDTAHPAYVRYFDEGEDNCSEWHPALAEEGWRLVGVYDTEDGPAAMFVRPLAEAG